MEEIIQLFSGSNFYWMEIPAAFFGILYVILAAKENIWCWLFGAISTSLQMFIFYKNGYPAQSALQIFYLMMAVYGYIMWNKQDQEEIKEWTAKTHLYLMLIGSIMIFVIGFILTEFFESSYPLLDSLTTVFSVLACYMVAKKVLESWLYWIIIDILIVYLCYVQIENYNAIEEYFLIMLYLAYSVLAIYGYFSWIKKMKTKQ